MVPLKINDCHIHLGKSNYIKQSFSPKDVINFRNYNNIDKIVLMGFGDYEQEQEIYDLVDQYQFVYGLHWLQDQMTIIHHIFNDRMIGCKWHGFHERRYGYDKIPLTKRFECELESLSKYGKVILIHCGRYKEASIESNTSYLHALEVAKIYPKLKVIMAHMGGTDTTICKRAINDSRDYPNIYFDTSGITTPYIIEYAVEQIPYNRILFGSDAPWCSFNAMLYTILDAQIDDDIKNAILYSNFMELIP